MANKGIYKTNAAVSQNSGKVGNVRYYQKGGNTYTRVAGAQVSNPRSAAQMRQRLIYTSKARLWAVLKSALLKCFAKKGAQSDFNVFMKLNDKVGVFYTKAESMAGACTAMPLQIASANGLQAIANTYISASRQMKTNIQLGSLQIGSATTVAAFSAAILANNPDRFKEGDEIAFISLLQSSWYTNESMEVPSVTLNKYRVVLSLSDNRVLGNIVSLDGFHTLDGCLATNSSMPEGCFGYLHTRSVNGSIKTAQSSLCNANEDYYDEWRTDEVFEIAAASYGIADDVFADPNSAEGGEAPSPSGNFQITVNVAEGQSAYGSVSGSGSYPEGTNAVLTATANTGYHFVSWNDGNSSASRTITVSESATYTATFAEDAPSGTVTVTLTAAEPSQGKVQINTGAVGATATATVQSGAATVIKGIPEAGYTFSKWSDGGLQFERTINPTQNTSLTATFEAE